MKRIILLLSLLFVFNANAEIKGMNGCKNIAGFAESVMIARQGNADIEKVLNVVKDQKAPIKKLMVSMILDGFEYPVYSTKSYKDREIKAFKNKYFVACMKDYE